MKLRIPPEVGLQDVQFAVEGRKNTVEEMVLEDSVVWFVRKHLSAKRGN